MHRAARAIIIEGNNLLLMHREKEGTKYFTLVGGRIQDSETIEQGLVREVKEETGLDVVSARLVFVEEHPEPYNEQYIYLCEVGPHESVEIQSVSEESAMNKLGMNVHTLMWAGARSFPGIPFRTPQLQAAIVKGLKKGFPTQPVKI
jgi:ADP-ribose pyrophosphatase YjhB (NUDIX family)